MEGEKGDRGIIEEVHEVGSRGGMVYAGVYGDGGVG